ncbi:alpha/beta fold hydrolase [Sphingorhabdus sp.]|uniref:alpha/beta fold hydrolase n=1 Tax=Sphingorhabdus sp. TaxID=1902408 RepID=UPI003594645D
MKLILSLMLATLCLFVSSSLNAKPTQCDPAKATKIERSTFEGQRFSVHIEGPSKGDVDDVILIPGLASPRDVWSTTVAAKSGCIRIHAVQIRGFGDDAQINADGPVLDPFIKELADYIAQHIVAKNGKKPAIIGHSMGGLSALIMAARYPDRVGKVMVVDALPFIGTLFNPAATVELVRPQAERMAASIRSSYGQPAPKDTGTDPGPQSQAGRLTNTAEGRILVDRWSRNSDSRVIAQVLLDVMTTDLRPELPKITAPVTLLYAQDDSAMTVEQSTAAFIPQYAGTPNFKAVQITGSYHFITLDQPEKFGAELDLFLDKKPEGK